MIVAVESAQQPPMVIPRSARATIRTATIYPAASNTELLGMLSHKDSAEVMQKLYERYGISPDRNASIVAFALDQPEDTNVNELTVGPANQPW
jgi:NADP-dependent 3-hydroxy acid dehydrogenase YdfG